MATDERQVAIHERQQGVRTTEGMRTAAANRVRSEVDTRSTQLADELTPYTEALHRAGQHLESQGSTTGGPAASRLADRIQQLSDYLRRSDADRFVGDVESFARARPWAAGGIGFAIGFLGARFVKASSETRYSASRPPLEHHAVSDTPLRRETVGGW